MNFWISRVFQKSVSPTLKDSGHFAKNPVTGYHLWEIPIDLGKIPNYPTLRQNSLMLHVFKPQYTLQGTNISHLGKRKIIFKSDLWWDMLDTIRVYCFFNHISINLAKLDVSFIFFHGVPGYHPKKANQFHLGFVVPPIWISFLEVWDFLKNIKEYLAEFFVGVRSLEIIIQYHPCMCHFLGGRTDISLFNPLIEAIMAPCSVKSEYPKSMQLSCPIPLNILVGITKKTWNIEHKILYTCICIYDILALSNWATLLMNCCGMQGYMHQDIGFAGYPSSFSQWNAGIHHVQVATSAQLVYNATATIEISNDVAHILLVIQHQKARIIHICSTGSYMVNGDAPIIQMLMNSFLSIILGRTSLYICSASPPGPTFYEYTWPEQHSTTQSELHPFASLHLFVLNCTHQPSI